LQHENKLAHRTSPATEIKQKMEKRMMTQIYRLIFFQIKRIFVIYREIAFFRERAAARERERQREEQIVELKLKEKGNVHMEGKIERERERERKPIEIEIGNMDIFINQ